MEPSPSLVFWVRNLSKWVVGGSNSSEHWFTSHSHGDRRATEYWRHYLANILPIAGGATNLSGSRLLVAKHCLWICVHLSVFTFEKCMSSRSELCFVHLSLTWCMGKMQHYCLYLFFCSACRYTRHFDLLCSTFLADWYFRELKFYFDPCIVWKWCNVWTLEFTTRWIWRHLFLSDRLVDVGTRWWWVLCSNECCWRVVTGLGRLPLILAFGWHCRDLTIYWRILLTVPSFQYFSYRY